MKCDYCKKEAKKVTGKQVYPTREDLWTKQFYICEACDARVGCHDDGEPFGRMANKELRMAKMEAHEWFDAVWKEGYMSRSKAYKWLSKELKLAEDKCHIGMFDLKTCKKVVKVCESQSFKGAKL